MGVGVAVGVSIGVAVAVAVGMGVAMSGDADFGVGVGRTAVRVIAGVAVAVAWSSPVRVGVSVARLSVASGLSLSLQALSATVIASTASIRKRCLRTRSGISVRQDWGCSGCHPARHSRGNSPQSGPLLRDCPIKFGRTVTYWQTLQHSSQGPMSVA